MHMESFTYHKKQIRHVITNYYEIVVMVEMASHAQNLDHAEQPVPKLRVIYVTYYVLFHNSL